MERRPRRNRVNASIRALNQETIVHSNDLIMPLFLIDGDNKIEDIPSMPLTKRYTLDKLLDHVAECIDSGLHHFIMFLKVKDELKDKTGSYGCNPDNFYLQAASIIKNKFPEITLISDIALDPYSADGHDGVVIDGNIHNDVSVEILCQMAIVQAQAGFDILGPSDMMDGRVGAIRSALDENGFTQTGIMSYTAKYASSFYGPFRDALDSAPVEDANIPADKKSYQMNPANRREALIEAELDTMEGADYLMVKPALHYLDIIRELKDNFELPIAAYHVSGECSMLLAATQNGWLNYESAVKETLTSIKRAGADAIITYFAKEYLDLIKH